ncbi:hypothetical protein THRCLA_06107 [Thraustotheca clavata]|uniref:Uncharacterized protein n=1 Tax=Thraustotheca clavata TaxID=74557 RepID=A0A1V9ZQK3_9STRA|nr:hypothetical protein THRCLA_06107 [Thraustotheca clavata]
MAPIVQTRMDTPTIRHGKGSPFDGWYDKVLTSTFHSGGHDAHYIFPTPHFLGLNESSMTAIELCLSTEHLDARLPLHLAIFEGNLTLVKTLLARRPELLTADALYCAAYWGELNLVKYLHSLRIETHSAVAIVLAALKGHTMVVDYLHEHRYLPAINLRDIGIRAKELPLLKFMLEDHFFASDGVYAVQKWAEQKKHIGLLELFHHLGM